MLLFEQMSAFAGDYPDIPHRPDFVVEDGDSEPVFLTLPIGKAGTTSRNGRLYDKTFYDAMVEQINHNDAPVTGIVGHRNPDALHYETKLPSLEWVGATVADDGTVWGKAYIYPEADALRGDVKRAKRSKRNVATSIWGEAVMDGNRATNPVIESIDYVDPKRAGVATAVAEPVVTYEMNNGDDDMSDNAQKIAELSETNTKLTSRISELEAQVGTLTAHQTTVTALAEMLGGDDVVARVKEMRDELITVRRTALKARVHNLIAEQVQIEGARPIIASMIRAETYEQAETALAELLEAPHIETMLQAMALQASGGTVRVGEQVHTDTKLEDTPENRKAAANEWGF